MDMVNISFEELVREYNFEFQIGFFVNDTLTQFYISINFGI